MRAAGGARRNSGPGRKMSAGLRETVDELRLNKFLAEACVASRRKADELITAGEVKVNGRTVTELGTKVRPADDTVTLSGKPVEPSPRLVYILLNKPKDCIVTTSDEKGRRTVLDLVPRHARLYPVGRLDRNTTGALLLTNDGDLAWRLTHPKFRHARLYRAGLDRPLRTADLASLRRGVELDDGRTSPCEAESLDPPRNLTVGIAIREGRNRQVRRMFEALGYEVRKLERIAFAELTTRGLKRGEWRYLEEHEVNRLRRLGETADDGGRPRRGKTIPGGKAGGARRRKTDPGN